MQTVNAKPFGSYPWFIRLLFWKQKRKYGRITEAMTLNKVNDALRRKLKEHWNDDAIVELTGLIAFQNLSSKFNSALDLPTQGFCRPPEKSGTNP